MGRKFTWKQRISAFLRANGKCQACGRELIAGWHVDHIIPWAKGGQTVSDNSQALCSECNLKKGTTMAFGYDKLRPWQKRFVNAFREWTDTTFLMVALPAGGKTIAALFAAHEWRNNAGVRERLIIVCTPTDNVRNEWKIQASKHFGVELQTKFDGALIPGMHGVVLNYHTIASSPEIFARLCTKYEVIAIFDEVHHIGTSAVWGTAVQIAFANAHKRLALSGTPWRSDGALIPFLHTNEQGEYEHQSYFDWPAALEEEPVAIRQLVFRPYDGSATYQDKQTGTAYTLHSKDTMSDEDAARCLRGRLLEFRFVEDVIRDAHAKLMELREIKLNAGGIILCMDADHVRKVSKWFESATGIEPVIAVSDDDLASHKNPIELFKLSNEPWIISIRQVSEGANIPRLMVEVYLTNYVTELFFRQAIGRIIRYEQTEHDREAYMFHPSHPLLNEYARKIISMQAIAIEQKNKKITEEDDPSKPRPESRYEYVGGSDAEPAGMILPTVPIEADNMFAKRIQEFARHYRVPETTAARIMQDQRQQEQSQDEYESEPELSDPPRTGRYSGMPLEDRIKLRSKDQSGRIKFWAKLTGREHKELHTQANRHAGCKSSNAASEDQLIRRAEYIESQIHAALNKRKQAKSQG